MKPIKMSAICAVIMVVLVTAVFVNKSAASKVNRNISGDGFAVLELFTSEGCSSCPPADALLARIQKEAGNKPVYVLAYHVDYWDRLGWKDIFSNPLFTKRQYQYSRQFTGQVYTPQVVVNGKTEFVGSDEPAANSAIKDALKGSGQGSLILKGQQQGGKIKVDYQVVGSTKNNQLLLAVVQKHAVSKVESGENGGRTLNHAQIVRNLYTFDLKSGNNGSEQVELPNGFNAQDWEIVGFLQNPETGVINAANRVSLNSTNAAL